MMKAARERTLRLPAAIERDDILVTFVTSSKSEKCAGFPSGGQP